jgi:hypothetical protein
MQNLSNQPDLIFALLFFQTCLEQKLLETQQELIDAQKQALEASQKVIDLQSRIDRMTPKNVRDEEVSWHIASGGVLSDDAAKSEDLTLVKRFYEWNMAFARRYVKPYVNPRVYSEVVTQMTRGLPLRIATLETQKQLGMKAPVTLKRARVDRRAVKRTVQKHIEDEQLALM